jgi:hypothetical protein
VVLAKEKTVLLNTTDRLIEMVRYSGMDINVEKTKVMTISRQPLPVQIKIAQKEIYFICLGTMITNGARHTREIKYRIAMAKAAFNKKKILFSSKLDLIWKKLVKCYIWSIALYPTAEGQISSTDHVTNEVLQTVKEEMNILHTVKERQAYWTGHNLHRNCLLNHVIEGKIEMMGTKSRWHKQLLDDLKAKRRYWKLRGRESTGLYSLKNSLWMRLWTRSKADYVVVVMVVMTTIFLSY